MSKPTREASSVGSMLVDRRPILKGMLNPKIVALIGAAEAPEPERVDLAVIATPPAIYGSLNREGVCSGRGERGCHPLGRQ